MIEELIQGVAARLKELWPGCTVYDQEILQNAPGAYYVGVKRAAQTAGLGRRRGQRVELEVRYYLPREGGAAFEAWAQTLLDGMQTLTCPGGGRVALRERTVRPNGGEGYYSFGFAAVWSYLEADLPEGVTGELMERLDQAEAIKRG